MTAVVFRLNPPVEPVAASGRGRPVGGPPLDLMASSDEAAAAYPPLPPPQQPLGPAAADDQQEAKRRRTEAAALRGKPLATAKPTAEGATVAGADGADDTAPFEPAAVFDDGRRTDFLGRSFRDPPATGFDPPDANRRPPSSLPKKQLAALRQGSGVQLLKWFPPVGHLLAAADLAGTVRLWDLTSRKSVVEYVGHRRPVKALQVTLDGRTLSTSGLDGHLRLWDVETGTLTGSLRDMRTDGLSAGHGGSTAHAPCLQHMHHPSDEQHLVLSAVGMKLLLWDLRTSRTTIAREYIGHQGSILSLALLDDGKRLLTTAEDKTMRTWDFRVPVIIKSIAGNAMHAMPHVAHHPSEPFIAAQSYDNKIMVFSDDGGGKIRDVRGREFAGQTVSGSMCEVQFSQDGRLISSGSVDGALHVWNWASGKSERVLRAHGQSLVSHAWHPIFPSMLATSSWDGSIKIWS